ncbi:transposable element Tc3 transposase [Trichonephila clavipes]|nr:transposable element Tc3 transposase [Trichonephila clavipes]
MITNFFIPELNNHDVQELWFQQDGATCHTARATIDLLKDTFGDRLISRFGPVNWPPRSCDLTPLDYFLWGYVKSLVYADKLQPLDHLEDNIRRVIADIRPQMLEKVIENWTSRLDYIRASRGSLMPEIIFKIRSSLQHFHNWITVGDIAGVSILQKLRQISKSHDVHFHWISSHVNIFVNEQEDLLAIEGCNASPPISSTFAYSEHQSRVKSEILKEWRTPPNHHWFESRPPGSSSLLKCGTASQTAISRLKSGGIKSLSFCGDRKTFALCTKCKTQQVSADHILDCLGLSREDFFSSPLLVLDF